MPVLWCYLPGGNFCPRWPTLKSEYKPYNKLLSTAKNTEGLRYSGYTLIDANANIVNSFQHVCLASSEIKRSGMKCARHYGHRRLITLCMLSRPQFRINLLQTTYISSNVRKG